MDNPTVGYQLIRGLGAPLRMICHYKSQDHTMVSYGADLAEKWFKEDKPKLKEKNSCINLPYIINGDEVVTQTDTCLLYLGKKLGIDTEEAFFHNHCVLDQTMDLRNDLMKIVYPFASVKTKEDFPEAAKAHMKGSATTNMTKLEAFCKGPFMCGDSPQSGDFHLFEMLDQHSVICEKLGEPDIVEGFPKLKKLAAAMKALPEMKSYFESDCHLKWTHNNGNLTHFTGQGGDFVWGNTERTEVKF